MFTSNSQCFSPFQSTVDRVIPCAAQNGQYFIKQQVAFKFKMGITNKRRDVLYRCYRVDQFFVDTVHQMGLFAESSSTNLTENSIELKNELKITMLMLEQENVKTGCINWMSHSFQLSADV